jgi:hypothetical protein
LFREQNGVENFRTFALGFFREDGLLFHIGDEDRTTATITLAVAAEKVKAARFNEPIELYPDDVAVFPDGTKLMLRDAQRYCYGEVGWSFMAERGNDASYPSSRTVELTLMAQEYTFSVRPSTAAPVVVRLAPKERLTYELGVEFELDARTPKTGPDGVILRYLGSGHRHGTKMGANGQEIPATWADARFEAVQGDKRDYARADLMPFDPTQSYPIFGRRLTVLWVSDQKVRVRVD